MNARRWRSDPGTGRTSKEIAEIAEINTHQENVSALYARHGHDRLVQVTIAGLPVQFVARVSGRLLQAAPGGTVSHLTTGAVTEIDLGPITSFRAVLDTIDFGEVTFADEPQRRIVVRVDRRKLEE